jgi:hypothetical protein
MYDGLAIDKAALRAIGWSNPEQFLKPQDQRGQPSPELLKGMEEIKIAHQEADAKSMTAEAAMIRAKQPAAAPAAGPAGKDPQEMQIKLMTEQNKQRQMELAAQRDQANDENRDLDREKDLQVKQMDMDRDQMNDAVRMQHERDMQSRDHAQEAVKLAMQVQSQHQLARIPKGRK